MASSTPKHILVFDNARCCSSLLGKLFSAHPDLKYERYPYMLATTRGPERLQLGMSDETMKELMKQASDLPRELAQRWGAVTFAESHERLRRVVEGAEREGKRAWIQEHSCYCIRHDIALASLREHAAPPKGVNPTHIPGDLIQKFTPVILIRNPILAFSSFLRIQRRENMLNLVDEAFDFWIHFEYCRYIYDYFESIHRDYPSMAPAPVIIDAEDMVHQTDALTSKLCELLDLSKDGARESWTVTGADEPVPEGVVPSFHDKIRKSTRVERGDGKIRDGDLEVNSAEAQWAAEFGADAASALRTRVDAQMPVYAALRELKLKL